MGWYYDYNDDDDFYEEPREPDPQLGDIHIQGPIYAVSRRGDIGVEWWGRHWVTALDRVMRDARLDRGKRYARNGSVQDLTIRYGAAFAHINGSRDRRYHTYVRLKPLTDQQWDKALQALSEQAIYSAKLLAGKMPSDIEAIFEALGTSLFPRSSKDLQFDCSCPDWGDPCKHSAALYYLLAEQLDADPFVLFHLRGRTRDQILTQLRAYRGVATSDVEASTDAPVMLNPALDADLEHYWGQPITAVVQDVPLRHDKPYAFRQLGDPPEQTADDLLSIYESIADEATRWLGLDTD